MVFISGNQTAVNDNISFYSNTVSFTTPYSGSTTGLYISNVGNVGIGTTTPSYLLHVNGAGYINGNLLLPTGNETNWNSGNARIIGNTDLTICASSAMHLNTGCTSSSIGTERITLNSSGNVGIGTTTPAYPLDVVGNCKLGNMLIRNFSKSLTQTNNDYSNICTITSANGAYTIHLDVVHSEISSSESKSYIVSINYSSAGALYYRLNPITTSGAYSGIDWAVEINVITTTSTLRLVRVSGNTTGSNYLCTLRAFQSQNNPVTITDSATTGTGATNSGIYAGTPITQLAGNVGIGTAAPAYPLDVVGNINFSGNLYKGGTLFSTSQWTTAATTTDVYISGNVGIKNTAPSAPLDITGTQYFDNGLGSKIIFYGRSGSGAAYGIGIQDSLFQIYSSTLSARVGIGYGYSGSFTETLSVIGGNVGIGTTAPASTLHIYKAVTASAYPTLGTVCIDSPLSGGCGGSLVMRNSSGANSGYASIAFEVSGDTAYGQDTTNVANVMIKGIKKDSNGSGILTFELWKGSNSTPNERLRIDGETGYVGIGTTAPASPLHVVANSNTDPTNNGLYVNNPTNAAGNHAIIGTRVAGTSGGNPYFSMDVLMESGWCLGIDNGDARKFKICTAFNSLSTSGVTTGVVLTINRSGQVGIGTTAPAYPLDVVGAINASADITAYSDRRIKTNIVTIDHPLDKIKKISGYYYFRSDIENSRRSMGVIAQELLDVIPEVVHEDVNGRYSVAYGNITAFLIEALKEEIALREKLEERVRILEEARGV